MQRLVVNGHVDHEPGVRDAVERVVLHACHHVPAHAASGGRAHHADVDWVFAIGFLRRPQAG